MMDTNQFNWFAATEEEVLAHMIDDLTAIAQDVECVEFTTWAPAVHTADVKQGFYRSPWAWLMFRSGWGAGQPGFYQAHIRVQKMLGPLTFGRTFGRDAPDEYGEIIGHLVWLQESRRAKSGA